MENLDFDDLIDNLREDAGVLIERMYALITLVSTEGIPSETSNDALRRIRSAADDLSTDAFNILDEISKQ